MNEFIKHFRREHDGNWSCLSKANLQTTQGRVQITPGTRLAPGTLFMNVDIVALLEEELHKINGNASSLVSQSPQDTMLNTGTKQVSG